MNRLMTDFIFSHLLQVDITELPEGETALSGVVTSEELGFQDDDLLLLSLVGVDIRLQKLGPKILADGEVRVEAEMTCGRCLERYRLPLAGRMVIQYVPADEAREMEGDGEGEVELVVPYQGKIVDLADDVRQTVVLSAPMKRLCRPDCRGLCPTCGANLNTGGVHSHGTTE